MTQYAQPTQTAVKVEELRMPGLDGMTAGREVRSRDKAALDYLVSAGKKVIAEYSPELDCSVPNYSLVEDGKKVYSKMYAKLRDDLLKHTKFDEATLRSYIFMMAERNYGFMEYKALGIYTGCLLSLLTERNRDQSKRTIFCINGKGHEFNYLFNHAHDIDGLIINNLKGSGICDYVATFEGKANYIVLTNVTGYSHLFFVGGKGGEIGLILAANCGISSFGDCTSDKDGRVGAVMLTDIGSDLLFGALGRDGNVGLFVLKDSMGVPNSGFELLMNAVVRKVALQNYEDFKLSNHLITSELIRDDPDRYQALSNDYCVERIFGLIKSISENSSEEEMETVGEQIQLIQEDIKPKLDKIMEKWSTHNQL